MGKLTKLKRKKIDAKCRIKTLTTRVKLEYERFFLIGKNIEAPNMNNLTDLFSSRVR